MASPTASVVLIGRLVVAAAAKAVNAIRSRSAGDRERRRRGAITSPTPDFGVDGEPLAIAWQRFTDIILAMNARNADRAPTELLAVKNLTDSSKVKLMAYVVFCARRRVRELAGLHPTPADLSALVAAHVEDYRKVIRDDGVEFYRVLKTIMPGPETMPANTLLGYASGALGVLLPEGQAAGWLAAIRQDAWAWVVRAEQNDLARGVDLYRRDRQPEPAPEEGRDE